MDPVPVNVEEVKDWAAEVIVGPVKPERDLNPGQERSDFSDIQIHDAKAVSVEPALRKKIRINGCIVAQPFYRRENKTFGTLSKCMSIRLKFKAQATIEAVKALDDFIRRGVAQPHTGGTLSPEMPLDFIAKAFKSTLQQNTIEVRFYDDSELMNGEMEIYEREPETLRIGQALNIDIELLDCWFRRTAGQAGYMLKVSKAYMIRPSDKLTIEQLVENLWKQLGPRTKKLETQVSPNCDGQMFTNLLREKVGRMGYVVKLNHNNNIIVALRPECAQCANAESHVLTILTPEQSLAQIRNLLSSDCVDALLHTERLAHTQTFREAWANFVKSPHNIEARKQWLLQWHPRLCCALRHKNLIVAMAPNQ
jgi:hypothetical protein